MFDNPFKRLAYENPTVRALQASTIQSFSSCPFISLETAVPSLFSFFFLTHLDIVSCAFKAHKIFIYK